MQEKEFIEICKRLIEQKFQLTNSESWKQRDFEFLSNLIFDRTSVTLSISTLKRIWKSGDRTPQLHTLNVLVNLLEYKTWNDFKLSHSSQTEKGASTKIVGNENLRARSRKSIYFFAVIPAALLFLGWLIFYYSKSRNQPFNATEVVFKSKKSITSGVPNTVVFEYDVSKLDFDSAFIQHSWDERMRARIEKNNHFQTFIYYSPGYHTAKLIVNNKIVKREKVYINTSGWIGLVNDNLSGQAPHYIRHEDIIHDGKLYVSRETLSKKNIPVADRKFYVEYFNVREFKETYGEDFTIETRLKNNLEEGALVCQYSQLTVLCENGRVSVPFCNPGCVANIHLHVGEIFSNGKQNDLTAFGIDLSDWRDIKISTIQKRVTVFVDNKIIYTVSFTKDLGKVMGLQYTFYGCGALDKIKLYNKKNTLEYSEEFDDEAL